MAEEIMTHIDKILKFECEDVLDLEMINKIISYPKNEPIILYG